MAIKWKEGLIGGAVAVIGGSLVAKGIAMIPQLADIIAKIPTASLGIDAAALVGGMAALVIYDNYMK